MAEGVLTVTIYDAYKPSDDRNIKLKDIRAKDEDGSPKRWVALLSVYDTGR